MPDTEAPAAAQQQEQQKKRKRRRLSEDDKEKIARIKRGPAVDTKQIKDKKLKGQLRHAERIYQESQAKAIKINEWLLPSDAGYLEAEGIERTWNFKQEAIVQAVDTGAARKVFDLKLTELGPYSLDFTRSGRYMLLGGEMGHLAMMDWQRSQLVCEVQVKETTRDVKFLHNEMFFAAAQKKYVYIYDKRGIEVHCCRDHSEANVLEFLPHHFLLASVGEAGVLTYQDTSTGHIVAQHRSKLGPCNIMRQNPHNAVLCLGHARGTVTMWSPNITTPLVKMLCHRGPVTALAVDTGGHHLVTAGADGQVKVWDIRMMKPLHNYFAYSPATVLDISQRGMLAVGWGRKVQIWRDALREKAQSPYMVHTVDGGHIRDAHFVPYEDVLGLGHEGGISTMLVPGAGEPNFDSWVANPFQGRKERREAEVANLLDKLQPDTIVLDPDVVGRVRKEPAAVVAERRAEAEAANSARRKEQQERNDAKSKMKGKNKPSRRVKKKQLNIIEEKMPTIKQKMQEETARKKAAAEKAAAEQAAKLAEVPRALHRFYKK